MYKDNCLIYDQTLKHTFVHIQTDENEGFISLHKIAVENAV